MMQRARRRSQCHGLFTMEPATNPGAFGDAMSRLAGRGLADRPVAA